jgi:ABC-type bacteriocin/lantibiotic exporter with double-glycine peptidase domain
MKVKYKYTKTPLDYQITEYDCGSTTLLNALRYLFERQEIPTDVIQRIMQYTLDNEGEGTSIYAFQYLSNWLNENVKSITTKIIKGKSVDTNNKELNECLNNNGVAILRVWQEHEHYVLLTKLDENYAYIFDPYYLDITYYDNDDVCKIIKDRPFEYNRLVKKSRLDEDTKEDFCIVQGKNREVLLINRKSSERTR